MTTKRTIPIFRTVNALSTRVDSLVPNTSSTVNSPTIISGATSTDRLPTCTCVVVFQPIRCRKSLRYTPQYFAMTEPAMSISRIRSQPITQATSSPIVVYVNVYADPATGITRDQEAHNRRRTGMVGDRLGAHGENTRADSHGNAHHRQVPHA